MGSGGMPSRKPAATITALPGRSLTVLRPLPVRFARERAFVIAYVAKVGAYAHGATRSEALDALRREVVDTFRFLRRRRAQLGPGLQRQWVELQRHVAAA